MWHIDCKCLSSKLNCNRYDSDVFVNCCSSARDFGPATLKPQIASVWLSNFTLVDFDKSRGIIKQGDIAGKKYRSVIDSLARLQTQTKERTKLILNKISL